MCVRVRERRKRKDNINKEEAAAYVGSFFHITKSGASRFVPYMFVSEHGFKEARSLALPIVMSVCTEFFLPSPQTLELFLLFEEKVEHRTLDHHTNRAGCCVFVLPENWKREPVG